MHGGSGTRDGTVVLGGSGPRDGTGPHGRTEPRDGTGVLGGSGPRDGPVIVCPRAPLGRAANGGGHIVATRPDAPIGADLRSRPGRSCTRRWSARSPGPWAPGRSGAQGLRSPGARALEPEIGRFRALQPRLGDSVPDAAIPGTERPKRGASNPHRVIPCRAADDRGCGRSELRWRRSGRSVQQRERRLGRSAPDVAIRGTERPKRDAWTPAWTPWAQDRSPGRRGAGSVCVEQGGRERGRGTRARPRSAGNGMRPRRSAPARHLLRHGGCHAEEPRTVDRRHAPTRPRA